jgi:hypothetical protein
MVAGGIIPSRGKILRDTEPVLKKDSLRFFAGWNSSYLYASNLK